MSSLVGIVKCGYCNSNMFKKKTSSKTLCKTVRVRKYQVDKDNLSKVLRAAKEKSQLSINDIALQLHTTRDVIAKIFASNAEKMTLPSPQIWISLKKLLKINNSKFDEALLTFEEKQSTTIKEEIICKKKNCCCVGSPLNLVEKRIINSLNSIFEDYTNYVKNYAKEAENDKFEVVKLSDLLKKEIDTANEQLNKICEAYETGIYTKKMFLERNELISNKIKMLNQRRKELLNEDNIINKYETRKKAIPIIAHVLENYNQNLTSEEKNKLLKTIIEKVIYLKDKGGVGYEDNFTLKIILRKITT